MIALVDTVIARVWKEGFGSWWAEVFTPADENDPPAPKWGKPTRRSGTRSHPPWPDGYRRRGLAFRTTRWGAKRAARKMKRRLLAGLPANPEREPSRVEVIEA